MVRTGDVVGAAGLQNCSLPNPQPGHPRCALLQYLPTIAERKATFEEYCREAGAAKKAGAGAKAGTAKAGSGARPASAARGSGAAEPAAAPAAEPEAGEVAAGSGGRVGRKQAEADYRALLRERGVSADSRWSRMKDDLAGDPRCCVLERDDRWAWRVGWLGGWVCAGGQLSMPPHAPSHLARPTALQPAPTPLPTLT